MTDIGPILDMDDILDEVIAWSAPLPLQPHEFTVNDYLTRLKQATGQTMSRGTARMRLEALVVKGKLVKRDIIHNGTHCNAYSFPEK